MTINEKLEIINSIESIDCFSYKGKQELIETIIDDWRSPKFNNAEDMLAYIEQQWEIEDEEN